LWIAYYWWCEEVDVNGEWLWMMSEGVGGGCMWVNDIERQIFFYVESMNFVVLSTVRLLGLLLLPLIGMQSQMLQDRIDPDKLLPRLSAMSSLSVALSI
jgi:hypothetical protein